MDQQQILVQTHTVSLNKEEQKRMLRAQVAEYAQKFERKRLITPDDFVEITEKVTNKLMEKENITPAILYFTVHKYIIHVLAQNVKDLNYMLLH